MENSDISQIELSRLLAVLQNTLDATTRTKQLIHASCDETKHLLNNWHIPDDSVYEEPPDCTLDDEDSRIAEVAKNIDQVVEEAQKLRETLSVSQHQPKSSPLIKRSNTKKISLQLGFGSVKLNDKVQKKTDNAKIKSVKRPVTTSNGSLNITKRSVNNQSVTKGSSVDNHSPRTTLKNTKKQSTSIPIVNGNYDKKAITKPRFKSGPSFQTTYQKDFLVHTNCTTAKKHNPPVSCTLKPKDNSVKDENTAILHSKNRNFFNFKNMENNPKKSSSTSLPEKTGVSDLEDLLCRVTAFPNISVDHDIKKSKIAQMKVNSCLLRDKTCHISEKAYRVVGLAEAVDVFGVPSDLVKVLKTYHYFLAGSQEGMKHGNGAGKRQAAAKSFLNKLSAMNDDTWSKFTYEPLVRLFSEYMALVSEVSRVVDCKFKDINDELIAFLQENSKIIEKKHLKWSNVNESVFIQPNTPVHNGITTEENYRHNISTDGWAMIGIWNSNSKQRFKALGEMQSIRYSTEVQWKEFEANVQEIQMLELQTEIFEVLESLILPQLFNYNPQDPTFPHLYKTVCSLCNMALLTSPLIIKSG